MAPFDRRAGGAGGDASRGRRLTRAASRKPTAGRRGRLLRLALSLACAAALLLPLAPQPAPAQSGRVKNPEDTSTRPRPKTTRPAATPTADAVKTPDPPRPEPTPAPTPRPKWMAPAEATPTPAAILPAQSRPAPTPSPGAPPPAADAQEAGEDEVVKISSNLVPIPATVVDAEGLPVLDLELKDFELEVDGVSRPLGDLHRSDTPVVMAMLFDNSSSLSAAREFEKKAAVQFFRRVMRPVDRAAIYSVSTIPRLEHTLTSDVRALVRTIEGFGKPEGATALLDGVWRAAEYLRPHPGRRVLVIVSDGVDTISDSSFEEVLARAVAAHCQIYVVQTGHSDNVNLLDLAARRRMQDFAAQTGGAVYTPATSADLSAAFAQIAADLAQQYVLSYYPSEDRRDGSFHNVSLRVATRPRLQVRTRKGYYAPRG